MDERMPHCCCFDASVYTGAPDTSHIPDPVSVPEVLKELDRLNNANRTAEGEAFLEHWLSAARGKKDWRAEISFLSELLGQYRRSGEKEKALKAIDAVLDLIREHGLGRTVSGATVLLNAATTMKCFGLAAESIPVFRHVARVYADTLDASDYRFAGLYNNMALSFADTGSTDEAEKYFRMALSVLSRYTGNENDMAVTWCSLAELYDGIDPEDPRIGSCMEEAWEALNSPSLPHDGYHAFTISKCLPMFDYFGYFLYAGELRARTEEIHERT